MIIYVLGKFFKNIGKLYIRTCSVLCWQAQNKSYGKVVVRIGSNIHILTKISVYIKQIADAMFGKSRRGGAVK